MKSPCLHCDRYLKIKDSPICMQCEARMFYAQYIESSGLLPHNQTCEKNMLKLIPTSKQRAEILNRLLTQTAARPQPRKFIKTPRVKLRTFRAFWKTARNEGFDGIREWFANDYLKYRRNSKYMMDKAGCASVTLRKMLAIYHMVQPAAHATYKTMAELDIDRVAKLLKNGLTQQAIAKDQGCSAFLIHRFKKLQKGTK